MFFFETVVQKFEHPTTIARFTKAVFGRAQVVRPDLVYGLLWLLLFLYSLREKELADSHGIINTNSRCENDRNLGGCQDEHLYKFVKRDVDLI